MEPQQATVSSVAIAQVWPPPADTEVKVPSGGVACPPSVLAPQQATVPSVRIAQVPSNTPRSASAETGTE